MSSDLKLSDRNVSANMESSQSVRSRHEKSEVEKGPSIRATSPDLEGVKEKSPHRLDQAEEFLRDNDFSHGQVLELLADEATTNKLLRKIDYTLLPLLCGTYMLQFIDKQALTYAAVFDLLSETHTSSAQYALLATWFYLAYLVAEYPWTALAQKSSISRVVGGNVVAWGSILMITTACSGYQGLAVCRFLLGVFEAPITPCFMMIVGMWYTRKEQPFRAGMFFCCNGVGSMVGGVLTYAIGQENNFPVWKAIFLLCGGFTVVWGVILLVFLPADIMSAKRFSAQEKAVIIGRVQSNNTGILNKTIKWYQVKECFTDPQVWILFWFVLLNETINGGVGFFGSLILKGVVEGPLLTTALHIPQGAFNVVFTLSGTYMASKIKNSRTTVMALYNIPTIVGICLLWKLPRDGSARYGLLMGFYIIGGFVTSLVVALQMPGANLGGYTKRSTATAFVFLAYCLGNMIGPQAFKTGSPVYPIGSQVVVGCAVGQIALAVALRMLLQRRNSQRDAAAAFALDADLPDSLELLEDITDFENPHFRYVL